MIKIRKQVCITKEQDKFLKEHSIETGVPVAETLRRLIDNFILSMSKEDSNNVLIKEESGLYSIKESIGEKDAY